MHATVAVPSEATWRPLAAAGSTSPTPRRYHSGVLLDDAQLVVYGGQASSRTVLGDVHLLDLTTARWRELPTRDAPPARAGHAAVLRDRCMWVFGGADAAGACLGDLVRLDLRSATWTAVVEPDAPSAPSSTPSACWPAPRYHHSAVLDASGERMFVFGGLAGASVCLNDLHCFSFATLRWSRVETENAPGPRAGHLSWCSPGNELYVACGVRRSTDGGGGDDDAHDSWRDVSVLDLDAAAPARWHTIRTSGIAPSTARPVSCVAPGRRGRERGARGQHRAHTAARTTTASRMHSAASMRPCARRSARSSAISAPARAGPARRSGAKPRRPRQPGRWPRRAVCCPSVATAPAPPSAPTAPWCSSADAGRHT